jgi:hypothetical protein
LAGTCGNIFISGPLELSTASFDDLILLQGIIQQCSSLKDYDMLDILHEDKTSLA